VNDPEVDRGRTKVADERDRDAPPASPRNPGGNRTKNAARTPGACRCGCGQPRDRPSQFARGHLAVLGMAKRKHREVQRYARRRDRPYGLSVEAIRDLLLAAGPQVRVARVEIRAVDEERGYVEGNVEVRLVGMGDARQVARPTIARVAEALADDEKLLETLRAIVDLASGQEEETA
jgi:hypothetical protein